MSSLPPLPKIDGDSDLMLDVHTHSSLRQPNTPMNEEYGDTNRLAILGSKVLDLCVTYHLYSERPFLEPEVFQRKREDILAPENLDGWLRQYGLKEKLRMAPADVGILEDPIEMSNYFHVYIGALYIRNGPGVIQTWISRLINPNIDVKFPSSLDPELQAMAPQTQIHSFGQFNHYPGSPSHSVSGHMSNEGYAPSAIGSPPPTQYSFHPPPPAGPPPPLPSSNPYMSSSLSLVTLALVNQTAAQKGYHISYHADQVGPPHQPTWTVRCCLNGTECGRGIGKSQKLAKEEAARQAWASMGWGPT